mmetsp:Transcript_38589/g.69100  ORF Transcript_38589/g.69100 Transcript_38589/m.69100 type:complete len:102 (-) Transcript_38589:739-1044(-)
MLGLVSSAKCILEAAMAMHVCILARQATPQAIMYRTCALNLLCSIGGFMQTTLENQSVVYVCIFEMGKRYCSFSQLSMLDITLMEHLDFIFPHPSESWIHP